VQGDPGRLRSRRRRGLACVTAAIPLQLDRRVGSPSAGRSLPRRCRPVPAHPPPRAAVVDRRPDRHGLRRLAVEPGRPPATIRGQSGDLELVSLHLSFVPALASSSPPGSARAGRPLEGHTAAPALDSLGERGGGCFSSCLVNIEIADFFSKGSSLTFAFSPGSDVGRGPRLHPRLGALRHRLSSPGSSAEPGSAHRRSVLLLVAVLKGFVHDMAQLGGLYRVGSFAGLGICLALMAVLFGEFPAGLTASGEPPGDGVYLFPAPAASLARSGSPREVQSRGAPDSVDGGRRRLRHESVSGSRRGPRRPPPGLGARRETRGHPGYAPARAHPPQWKAASALRGTLRTTPPSPRQMPRPAKEPTGRDRPTAPCHGRIP